MKTSGTTIRRCRSLAPPLSIVDTRSPVASHSNDTMITGAARLGQSRLLGMLSPQPLVLLLLLLLWQLLSMLLQQRLLPSPEQVATTLWQHIQSGELIYHLGTTLARVGVSFSIAMLLGVLIGVAMGRSWPLNRWLDPLLVLLLNLPALVTIILLYVWLGMSDFAAVLAVVINKVPNVVVAMREGTRGLDPHYQEMASIYRLSRWKRFREVILPQLAPYLLISARTGLALIWKIVLVVELLGRSNGVGFQLHLAFQMFDVAAILAYSLAFIAIVQAIEWLVLQPLEQRQRRWRRQSRMGSQAPPS